MGTPIELVLERLATITGRSPRRNGTGWVACCPAHDDGNPSLSASEGHEGQALLHCHAGCTLEQILAALKIQQADLFPPKAPTNGRGPAIATYDYTDRTGTIIYQVIRYANKEFRQRQPNGPWTIKGLPRLIYRAHELQPDTLTLICEGEKDVNTAWAHGWQATCNSGGAGKWTAEHAAQLTEIGIQHVVIIADNDPAGYQHARQVAATLPDLTVTIARSQYGKDLTDHVESGHTIDDIEIVDIEQLVAEPTTRDNPEDNPSPDNTNGQVNTPHPLEMFRVNWATLWDHETDAQWLCEPVFALGRAHAIVARGGTGKSLLLLNLAAALATGQPILHTQPATPLTVVYVDLEMTKDDILERLDDMGYGPDTNLEPLHYLLGPSMPGLDTPAGGDLLVSYACDVNAQLVIVDTLSRVISGPENDSDTLINYARHTGNPLKNAGITAVRADHAGKDPTKGARGSSAKDDDVDLVWYVHPADDNGITLKRGKCRMNWVPENVPLTKHLEPLHYETADKVLPPGTLECAALLDLYDVPVEATKNEATRTLKEKVGKGRRTNIILAALRYRRDRELRAVPDRREPLSFEPVPRTPEPTNPKSAKSQVTNLGTKTGTRRNQWSV